MSQVTHWEYDVTKSTLYGFQKRYTVEGMRNHMANISNTHHRFLILLTFIYLSIPNFLFLVGWFHPLCSVCFVVTTFHILRRYSHIMEATMPPVNLELGNKKLISFALCLLLLVLFFIIAGVVGYFPTHGDSWAFRQALFLNLKDGAWPLVLPNGREMSYYLAGMLPASIFARILPNPLQSWAILIWIMVPLTITLLYYHRKKGFNLLLFTILALGFQDPLRAIFRPNATFGQGRGFMAELLTNLHNLTGCDFSVLTTYYGNQTLMAPFYNCIGAYNSVPATILVGILILHLKNHVRLIPLAIAMLVPISPFGAIACMPIALFYYLPKMSLKLLPALIFPVCLALVYAVYFMRAESGMNVVTAAWVARGSEFWVFFVRYLAGAALLLIPIYPHVKQNGLYWVLVASIIFIPMLFIGSLPNLPIIHGFNELFLKGSIVYSMLIVVMWCENWEKIWKPIRWAALAWAIAATAVFCFGQAKKWDPKHQIADMWNGHLCHERDFLNQSIPETKKALIPRLILNKSGEAEKKFPGCLLPAGGQVDYNRKPHPQAFP